MERMRLFLLELTAYDPAVPGTRVLRFASDGFQSAPGDSPANTFYEPRLVTPLNLERRVLVDGYSPGSASGGFGEIVLRNDDGGLDYMVDLGIDGRVVVCKVGFDGEQLASFKTLFTGTVTNAEFSMDAVSIRVRDKSEMFDKPLQETKYLGTNSLPAGLEGVAGDLKGKTRELCYGYCLSVAPSLVNTSSAIYKVHDGPVDTIEPVATSGVFLNRGADFATSALLMAAGGAPAAGAYTTCHAEGLFRLVQPYDGMVTAWVRGDKAGGTYVSKAADIISRIATTRGGLQASELHAASFAAMAAASTGSCGFFMPSGDAATIADAMNFLCAGLGNGFWFFDRDGKLRVGRFSAPGAGDSPAAWFSEPDILDIERLVAHGLGDGIPAWRATVRYSRNWTVMSKGELAGHAAASSWLNWFQEEYRDAVSSDSSVKTKHLLASEMTLETPLVYEADAQAEAGRLLGIYKADLARYRFNVHMDAPALSGLSAPPNIGDVVSLSCERFGLSSGKKFVVVGVVEDWEDEEIEYEVLG